MDYSDFSKQANINCAKICLQMTYFIPRASWPTGSLRFLLLLGSFLRKKPSGNQRVLCSLFLRVISMPIMRMIKRKREAIATSINFPHSVIKSNFSLNFSPVIQKQSSQILASWRMEFVHVSSASISTHHELLSADKESGAFLQPTELRGTLQQCQL